MVCNPAWLIRNYYRPWKNIYEMAKNYKPPPPIKPPKRVKTLIIDSLKQSQRTKQNGNTNTINVKNTDINKPEKVDRSKNYCCIII